MKIINGHNLFGKFYFLKFFIKDFLNGASECIHENIWAIYILIHKKIESVIPSFNRMSIELITYLGTYRVFSKTSWS